jgi:DNA-binding MarR family transcriptional regulator
LATLLESIDDEPDLAALCLVHALEAGPRALARRNEVIETLVAAVEEGRAEAKVGLKPTRITAEGVVGAVLGVLYARLAANAPGAVGAGKSKVERDDPQPVLRLLNQLTALIVLPYRGAALAAREAARPTPRRCRPVRVQGDPLRDLDMRLTYRTLRVLLAIAANPAASNRRIAEVSGVADQGQISKLLARLEHLGLTVNGCTSPARGEPNSWELTARGQQIERAVADRTSGAPGCARAATPL